MKFIRLEIKENIQEGKGYFLKDIVEKMDVSFYEKWDQHLENSSKTAQELYEQGYEREFDRLVNWDGNGNAYLLNSSGGVIGEMSFYLMLADNVELNMIQDCSFCKDGGVGYKKISSKYVKANELDPDFFTMETIEFEAQGCDNCDTGTIREGEYKASTMRREDAIYIGSIKIYDKFEYFQKGLTGLEDKGDKNE